MLIVCTTPPESWFEFRAVVVTRRGTLLDRSFPRVTPQPSPQTTLTVALQKLGVQAHIDAVDETWRSATISGGNTWVTAHPNHTGETDYLVVTDAPVTFTPNGENIRIEQADIDAVLYPQLPQEDSETLDRFIAHLLATNPQKPKSQRTS